MTRKSKYNVLLIVVDGARYDRIKDQKNFQMWAQKGTLFSKIITYGTQTVTSMHASFTGIYGNINGAYNYFGSALFRKESCKTLAQYLKEAGFNTFGDTINEIVVPKQGFDKLSIHDEKRDNLADRHRKMIKDAKKKGNFFLYLHYSNIHTGLVETVLKKYDDFDKNYFKNKDKNLENYDKYIKQSDEYLGKIFETCEELNLFKDTIILIMSDHGASVGDKIGEIGYGRYCYDYTLRTFSLFVQPEIFPFRNIEKMGRTIDILPTILDILRIPISAGYIKPQGKSLMKLMDHESDSRIAFSEGAGLVKPYPTKKKPLLKAVRTNDWKLIYNIKTGKKELYELNKDPEENCNVVELKPEIAEKLFSELIKICPEVIG